jgi:fatty-acyl-CoA synthase
VSDDGGSITYGELDRRTNALARGLLAGGLAPGGSVGILCRDHRGAVEVMAAAGKAGARLVLLNTGFAEPQLADVAAREGIGVLFADAEFADLAAAIPGATCFTTSTDTLSSPYTSLDDLIAEHSDAPVALPREQGGLVLLTGGTTGTPKGAPRRITSPLAAAQFLERIPQRRGDVVYIAAPIFHGTGLSQLIIALNLGSTVVVRRRFDALATLQGVAESYASVLVLVPTMLQRILALPEEVSADYDTSSLRVLLSAGAALPAELGDRATRRFGDVIHNFYGCTEVALATVAMPEDWAAAPGTVGRSPRGISVRLLDSDDQVIARPGVQGRIYVRNSLAFKGYSGGGAKQVIDGHMSTGDTGHFDEEGRLFIDGRDDDMIVSGGENVFPQEIEDLVRELPGIADAAAVGVPDEEFGQRLRVFAVLGDGAAVTEEEVKTHVRTRLARFKVPRDVVFVGELPYTAAGKLSRRALVESLTTTTTASSQVPSQEQAEHHGSS